MLAESVIERHEKHYPTDPNKFVFDEAVAKIFPSMAVRSIPTYAEGHRLHSAIASRVLKDDAAVLDIGASRGEFFHALDRAFAAAGRDSSSLRRTATDVSPEMCAYLRAECPGVEVIQQDLMENDFLAMENDQYDFINCMYTLQFLPTWAQPVIIAKMMCMLKPGGILSLGQKDKVEGKLGELLHDEYIEFRMRNGYTREEIERKTAALNNSMWPMTRAELMKAIDRCQFAEVMQTSQWGVFSTYLCVKA